MALNKKFEDIQKLYDKLGWDNAETLKDAMGKSPDYMYIAFLSQLDTDAPVENVLYNDVVSASPIYFSYEGSGIYRMHCNLFRPGYMEVEIHDGQGSTFVDSTITATVYTGYVELKVFNFGTLSDSILQNTPIKIKVWSNAGVEEASVAPTPFGYRYAIVNDTTCSAFSVGACDWTASGGLLSNASFWSSEMPAFYPDGSALLIDYTFSPCSLGQSSYFLKTIGTVDPGVMTLTDANCNPAPNITWNLITGPLKNYSGTIPTGPLGSGYWTLVSLPGDTIGIDGLNIGINDPVSLALQLQYYFQIMNNPTCTVTATDLGGGSWQIDVNQIYSNSISVELQLAASPTYYSLYLVP